VTGRTRSIALVLTVAVTAGGCTLEEALPEAATTVTPTAPTRGLDAPDPHVEQLAAGLGTLRGSVVEARTALLAAAGDDGTEAAARAVALLTADDELTGDVAATGDLPAAPLFPGRETSRLESVNHGDSFTEALTVARSAGSAGRPLVDLLRDPVAGDLGAWQRGAEGMLDAVDAAARATTDVAAAEAAVAELPGEGTKALAWALLARRAGTENGRAAFAERGVAHLDLVLGAIDELAPAPGAA
jgi:hypothetical protein